MSTSKLEALVTRARLLHIVHALSALHFGAENHFAFEGDPARGRSYAFDGSGNHVVVGWSEAGIVACGFDHDFVKLEEIGDDIVQKFWDAFPEALRDLGKELGQWKSPVNGAAWFASATGIAGDAENQYRVRWLREPDEAKLLSRWEQQHGISPAQMELARSLARATSSGRHALTETEIAVALAHPESGEAPGARAIAAAQKHLAAAGVDWS